MSNVACRITRGDILRFLFMVFTIDSSRFYQGDKLDTERLANQTANKLNLNDDSELVASCIEQLSEAIGRATAKESDSNMSFDTALASELF